jgi:hypothetical protein
VRHEINVQFRALQHYKESSRQHESKRKEAEEEGAIWVAKKKCALYKNIIKARS